MKVTTKKMGELVTLQQGFAVNKKTNHHISDIPTDLHLLRIGDMKNGKFSVYVRDTIPKKFIASHNDIIYTRTGRVGLVFRNQEGVIHNNCFTVTPKDEKILNRDYLFYLLQSKEFFDMANSLASGAAQPDLTHTAFNSISVSVPSIDVQKKISRSLLVYDDLICNNRRQIQLLEEIIDRIYKEWFIKRNYTKYVTCNDEKKTWSEWEKVKLSSLGKIITGKTPSTEKKEYYGGEIPFIKIPDMHDGIYPIITETSLTVEGADSQINKYIPAKSIIVSCIGTVGLVNITVKKCQTNQQINALILNNEKDLLYVYSCMKQLKKKMDGVGSNGATMTNVNKSKFSNLEIIYPPVELVEKYYFVCKPIFEKIYKLCVENIQLEYEKKYLFKKMMIERENEL